MAVKPNISLGVKIYMNIVNNSGEFGSEIVEEATLNDIYYDAPSANAACGIGLYQYLKDNCRYWNPNSIHFQYFEQEQTSGVGMLLYEDSATFYTEDDFSCDLLIEFYPKNFEIEVDLSEQDILENETENENENELLLFDENKERK